MTTSNIPTNTDTTPASKNVSAQPSKEATSDTSASSLALKTIQTQLAPDEVIKRIAKLSQRGRLPGFETPESQADSVLFTANAFGQPFDKTLEARAATSADNTTTLIFTTKLKPALPWTFGVIIALSIWPGVWFTDELFRTYFDWYDFVTWMWYLPLTILPLPWMIKSIRRKTQTTTAESAAELVELIRTTVDGTSKS